MMGLEPTTFCMATRPSLPQRSAWFRLYAGLRRDHRALGLQEGAGDGTARKPNACKALAHD
jgi:hypothetical protein